jgi:glycosyltransferase involved in cell wall biosynthesis
MDSLNMNSPLSHIPSAHVAPLSPSATKTVFEEAGVKLRLRGVKVCHLTPIQNWRDDRAFSRESLSALPYGLRCSIVGPHSMQGSLEGVEFVPVPSIKNRALRILFGLRLLRWALPQKADIWHVHSPELIPAALILKLIFRKKVVYDTREDFPAMMLTKTYLAPRMRKFMSKAVAAAEDLAARSLNGVVTADPGSLRPLSHTGRSKKLVFYNFPNLRYFSPTQPVEKTFDLVYRGGLSERAGTFVLLRALRYLLDSGIPARLLLFGYMDNEQTRQTLNDTLAELGVGHLVAVGGLIPHSEMAATLSRARISICPLQNIPKFMNNIPVKVFESWACGLPVIASDLPPIRPFFRNRPYGFLFEPGNAVDLACKIRRLLESPQLIEHYGQLARQAVLSHYNNAGEVRKLISFYKRVLSC